MTKRLIVNADDYGRTSAVSAGIRAAHQHGIVTSTSVMVNMPGIEIDLRSALRDMPKLGLGVHLVISAGQPRSDPANLPSLINEKGHFHSLETLTLKRNELNIAQVKTEWKAQIEFFMAVTGKKPDHLDSHHHVSYYTPWLFRTLLELAQQYGCAIRLPLAKRNMISTGLPENLYNEFASFAPSLLALFKPRYPDYFTAGFYGETATKAHLLETLSNLPDGSTEIMSHPGYADTGLIAGSSYARQRVIELNTLTNHEIKDFIKSANIKLINFGDL